MTAFEKLSQATATEQAELLALPFVQSGFQGLWSLDQYLAFLEQAYHHVKHTLPLLMAAGSRFSQQDEDCREAMAEYIDEELGHQRWILNDINLSGGDGWAAVERGPGQSCEIMVAYAYDTINRVSPFAFLGMVHVLEGTSVCAATQAAEQLQKNLNLPKEAFSYLISHGSLDISHVEFFESIINKIKDDETIELIIHHAKNFFHLYGNIFRELEANTKG